MTTRDQITYTALKLYSKLGINKVSMNQIAAAVGITKPAIYYYFPSKEALLESLVELTFFRYLEKLINYLNNDSISPIVRLEGIFTLAADDFLEWNEKLAGDEIERVTFDLLTFETIAQYPKIEERYNAYQQQYLASAASVIEEGRKLGEIRDDTDCEDGARALVALLEGTYFVCADNQNMDIKDVFIKQSNLFLRIVQPLPVQPDLVPLHHDPTR